MLVQIISAALLALLLALPAAAQVYNPPNALIPGGAVFTLGSTAVTYGATVGTVNGLTLGTSTALGTPASGTLTNTTGFPVANLAGAGTGVLTALGIAVGSAGAPVTNGGTFTSGTLSGNTTLPGSGQLSSGGKLGLGATPAGLIDAITSADAQANWSRIYGGVATFNPPWTSSDARGVMFGWNKSNGGGETNLVFGTNGGTAQRLAIASWSGTTLTERMSVGAGTNGPITFGVSGGAPQHWATVQNTAPALTSCGGGSPAITGTDTAGIVTMGTSATGCIITFNAAYTGTPFCVVSWIATPLASQSYVTSNSAITLTQTSTSGNKVQYICMAPSGG